MQFHAQKLHFIIAALLVSNVVIATADAQRGGRGGERPPSKVVLTSVEKGMLAPQTQPSGTVYFKEVAQLATEVSAKVMSVNFEEGQHVKKGDVLVELDASVLAKDLQALRAMHDRRQTEFQDAKVRFERGKDLLEDDVTTPQEYDDLRFAMEGMQHQVEESLADVERLKILIDKHTIRAPFDAIVLERSTELGEWKTTGASIAAIALENVYDIIVNIHEQYLPFLKPGQSVPLQLIGSETMLTGEVVTIIQRGDLPTRTFPLKIRVEYNEPLYEGMGAIVSIPRAAAQECLIVERDAVVLQNGESYVYTAKDGFVKRHEIVVLGHDGMNAGITAANLGPGDMVIVKGHERLKEGDEVVVVEDVLSAEYLAGGA